MRILALSSRVRPGPRQINKVLERLDLGNDVHLELVTVHPPIKPLPVARVDAVDPSVLPWRPLIPVSSPNGERPGILRRATVRAMRTARNVINGAPLPDGWRVSRQTMLATACATSRELAGRAASMDVVLATDRDSALGAWYLARRVPGPAVVYGPQGLRGTLERLGRSVPPRASLVDESGADSAGQDVLLQPGQSPPTGLPAPPDPETRRLLIAPANYAGQGHAWAKAVRDHVPGATAMNARAGDLKHPFPADYSVSDATMSGDVSWRLRWREFVEQHFTHAIIEANRPIFGAGTVSGRQSAMDLERAGIEVALLSHGSDARIPSIHAAAERWHPYDAMTTKMLASFERSARLNVEFYNSFPGTVFVSTPGLLAFVPEARWLPVVIDYDLWSQDEEPMAHDVPVVAHIPSSAQKGSHMIDPVLSRLAARGVIEYLRVEGVPHKEMPALYSRADIMVEQFGIADYSTAACEAMASNTVVVSRVADGVRHEVRRQTGRDLPIVEANPETLEEVIVDLIDNRDHARGSAKAGQEFCREIHDGRFSAGVLAGWLSPSPGA